MSGTTVGTLLGGRVRYEQPAVGFRTGIEPVLLAAAVPARPGERVVEGGTGAGAVLICLAARVLGVCATGIERDPALAAIAMRNAAFRPGLRVVVGEIEDGLRDRPFDHACANPPWHDPAGTASPDAARRAAKQATPGTWRVWCGTLARMVRPGGTVTIILPVTRAALAVQELARAGAEAALQLPLRPKRDRPPKLAIVQARAGASGASRICRPLVLHEDDGRFAPAAEAVLRDGNAIDWENLTLGGDGMA